MTNKDELERQAFERWIEDFYPLLFTGTFIGEDGDIQYVVEFLQGAWTGWQVRAKQESNHD